MTNSQAKLFQRFPVKSAPTDVAQIIANLVMAGMYAVTGSDNSSRLVDQGTHEIYAIGASIHERYTTTKSIIEVCNQEIDLHN